MATTPTQIHKGGRRALIATGCQIVSLRGESARAFFLASISPVSLPIFAFRDCRALTVASQALRGLKD
jgi:hypothetical protein